MAMKTQIRPAGLKINADLKPESDSATRLGGVLDTTSATGQDTLHSNIVSGQTIGSSSAWIIAYQGVVSGAGSAATNASSKLSEYSQSLSSSSGSIALDYGTNAAIDVSIGDLILAKSGDNYMPFIVMNVPSSSASSMEVKYHGGITSSGITIVSSISGVVTDIHKPSLSSGGCQTDSNATIANDIYMQFGKPSSSYYVVAQLGAACADGAPAMVLDAVVSADSFGVESFTGITTSQSFGSLTRSGVSLGKAWSKVIADNVDLRGQGILRMGGASMGNGRIDLDADDDTSIRASADDVITIEIGGSDKLNITSGSFHPESDALMDLGTSAIGFNDLHLGSGGVINFDGGDVTMTHSSNTVTVAGGTLATAALTMSTVVASGIIKTDDTTEATSTTDGSLQTDGGLSVAKSAVIGDDLDLLSDGAIMNIGSTSKFTITDQAANNCVMATADHRLAFGNAGEYISGDGTDLDIISSGDLDITATLVDVTGALTVSGTTTASGRLLVDDATEATSTTDGSLQTDGGLSVAKDIIAGDDVFLLSDSAVLGLGAGKDVTITHDGGTGATLASAGAFVVDGAAAVTVDSDAALTIGGASIDMDADGGAVAIDGTGGVNLGTATSGVAISIGHGTSEVTVNDNLTVTGDLTINGATTTVSTTNMIVEDKFIELGNGVSGSPSGDAGFVIERGSSTNVALIWDESEDEFVLGSGSVTGASTGNLSLTPSDLQVGSFRATKLEIDGASDYIDVDTDLKLIAAADIVLDPGGSDVKIDGNALPNSSDGGALGSASLMWSDAFLASGAVVNFNNGDVTMTHSSNAVTIAGGTWATAALTSSTITASGIVKTDDTTEATSTTDGSLQTDGGLSVAKSAVIGDDLDLLSDGAILNIGSTSKFTLTDQAANNCVMAASGARLAFGNAGEYISGDGTDLDIISSGDLDITATLVDVTGALTVSGLTTATGRIVVDDATEATSATDGSLQTDGGLSVVKSAVIGDDLDLLSDSAIMSFGAGKDVTFTHDGGTGMDIVSAGALDISSSGASVGVTVIDGQTLTLGQSGASCLLLSPHGTAGSELASLINTAGTTDGSDAAGAILLSSVAGGMSLAWADSKDLWAEGGSMMFVANEDKAECIKLHADAGTSQTISLQNDAGTSVTSILLQSDAGGIKLHSALDNAAGIHLDSAAGMTFDGGDTGDSFLFNNSPIELESISAPSTTTNKLYAVSGALYWNGTALGSDARSKVQLVHSASVSADTTFLYNGVSHNQGSDADKTDIYLNGQLMMSGTSSSNGDYKIHGLAVDGVQFFFGLESDDVVTVVTV